jgi:hemerythrin
MMDYIVWQTQWNTNIPEIDERHAAMVGHLNDVIDVLNQATDGGDKGRALDKLLKDYIVLTREHFASEEEQMQRTKFPDYARHKREHVMLLAELNQLTSEISKHPSSLDMRTVRALKQWLVAHFTSADKAYADYHHARK